jgi:hypothetical protein
VAESVTLETKCWDADWELILKTDRLRTLATRNCFDFVERVLMINNVTDVRTVTKYATRAVDRGLLTRYVVVDEHASEALRFFQLSPEALTRGYVYSIAELVSVYLCRTDYLLHYAGDCVPAMKCDWLPRTLEFMQANPQVKVANLTWDHKYDEAKSESSYETDNFYVGFGFSDQCYLVRTCDFRAPIYGERNIASERYPDYGGELFEKRVDAWMRNHQHLRATFRHASYVHEKRRSSLKTRLLGRFSRLWPSTEQPSR